MLAAFALNACAPAETLEPEAPPEEAATEAAGWRARAASTAIKSQAR